jgi:hypothetical protein
MAIVRRLLAERRTPGLRFFLSFPLTAMRNDTETFRHIPSLLRTGAMPGIFQLVGW